MKLGLGSLIDLSRIFRPLRLARGSHKAGSGKGCAMQVISYINGDAELTDYPSCSARPLASLVHMVNDRLADEDGMLSPANAVIALELGWLTVGTADVPESVLHLWQAEMMDSPVWGVLRFADAETAPIVREVADIHRRMASGELTGSAAYSAAHEAERAAERAAARSAERAAAHSAYSAAESVYVGKDLVYSAAHAAYSARSAAHAADSAYSMIDFTRTAIEAWRRIARLGEQRIDYNATNSALATMTTKS